jgi:hypothetical protein
MKWFVLRKHRPDYAFNIFNFVIGRNYNNTVVHISRNFIAKVTFLWDLIQNYNKKIDKKISNFAAMIEHLLHPRIIESKDWATILFVLAFAIVTH